MNLFPRRRWWLWSITLLAPLGALAAVWLPLFIHFHVASPVIDASLVQQLRTHPNEAVLAEIDSARYQMEAWDEAQAAARADDFLRGRHRLRDRTMADIGRTPSVQMLHVGMPGDQLDIASLTAVDSLLAAWRLSGKPHYFDAALQTALEWARYERSAWLPVGFLWNDHAIGSRVTVLTRLWRVYRQRPDFDAGKAAELLAFVSRSVTLLARPSHYTARTNHGIMQNLALLHAAVAFPQLPAVAEGSRIGVERMQRHLPYFVAPDGAVLEHSVGYQDFAIHLLGLGERYARLLGLEITVDLERARTVAECRMRSLQRPDGSVPIHGDTWNAIRVPPVTVGAAGIRCPESDRSWIDEEFGYASLRSEAAHQQATLVWSNFVSRAHKHDDELALWLWQDGRDWLGTAGYWPYGEANRDAAVSWRGANAPHADTESRLHDGPRSGPGSSDSRLLAAVTTGPLQALDVERRMADGRSVRRQLVLLPAGGSFVLDSSAPARNDSRMETIWTFDPALHARSQPVDGAAQAFALAAGDSGASLAVRLLCPQSCDSRLGFGWQEPFGGLVARDNVISSAPVLTVSAPFGSSVGLLLDASLPAGIVASLQMGDAPEQWALKLDNAGSTSILSREGLRLSLTTPVAAYSTTLQPGAAQRPQLAAAAQRYQDMAQRYPVFRDYLEYRWRATALIGALAVLQYPALWLLGLLRLNDVGRSLLTVTGWLAATGWLYHGYLV